MEILYLFVQLLCCQLLLQNVPVANSKVKRIQDRSRPSREPLPKRCHNRITSYNFHFTCHAFGSKFYHRTTSTSV